MIIGIKEIVYLTIMSLVIGFIFSSYIRKPRPGLQRFRKRKFFDWEDFKFALIITAPAIVLHELGHKFTAIALGFTASFEIFWSGLGLGILLKLLNSPFLILAPGYVSIPQNVPSVTMGIIALAGPLVNLILFLITRYILNHAMGLTRNQAVILHLTKQINLLLFIFNMLPIPPLDGSKIIYGLFSAIF